MPLYEYECFVCNHRFERIQRVADAAVVDCPECGGAVRRLLGAPALQFKGSGWYVTDYGKNNGGRSTALAKAEDSPPPPPESKPPKKEPAKKSNDTN
jgi:putative FmdB family regulatory protein